MDRPKKNLPDDVASIMPMQGHVFEGKYRVVRLIGAGGFARVFHARFEDVARDVALKVLVPESSNPATMYPEELVQRFLREARAVSDLRSPHTITLHDFGRTRQGLLYMVFEFIDGTPVDRLIKEQGALPAWRVANIVRQICLSLREAHKVGMLHRDIKPANVMVFDYLDERDQVKLLDFGIAKKWTHGADGMPILDDLTEDGTVMGTPRYMSPEQIVGQQLTPKSDIYGLGLLTYEMLAGQPAAPQTQKTEVVRRHLGPEPFQLPAVNVSPQFRQLVERMLAKDINQRFGSIDEILQNLEALPEVIYDAEDLAETQATGVPAALMHRAEQVTPMPVSGVQPVTAPAMVAYAPGTATGAMPPGTAVHGGAGASQQIMGQQPANTFIQMRSTPASFEVDVPMKPTKKNLIIAGATFVPFFLAFTVGGIIATILFAALFAFGLSFVFTTYRLRVTPQDGYEVTRSIFTYDQSKRGPMVSVVRFDARGTDADDDTVLKLVTHEGEHTIANAFSEAENAWIAAEGNAWIARLRQQNPNPVG